MPQLDIAFFVPQIFWLIVVFATLYIFMAGSAAPKIAGVLKKRQDAIAGDLVEAEKLQAKAESARVLYEKSQSEARSNVAAMVLSKREELKDIAEKEYLKLSKKLTAKADKAQMRIDEAKNKALSEVREVATEVCSEIVLKIAGLKIEVKDVAKVIDANTNASLKGDD
ncbi:MAG: F0F1 ATP synthase subunit B family protein [Sphingomonadales bacterium]